MFKKFARWVLRDEIQKGNMDREYMSECAKGDRKTIDRLNDLCNKLKDEAFTKKGYIFSADRLTESEQVIIGKSIKHEIVGLFKKMFKQYADINADLLYHNQHESVEKRTSWALAVRIYDDLVMQLQMCDKLYSNKDRLKALERKNAKRKREQSESV